MRREKKNYSVEFKQKAVELTYARGSVSEICRELDIPRSVLGRWRKESKDYGDNGISCCHLELVFKFQSKKQ